jgi:hypothetical protein
LLTGGTLEQAAERSGLSRSTVWRRSRRPDFAAELARRQRELVDRIGRRIVASATVGLDALTAVARDEDASANARVDAAKVTGPH